MSSFTDILIVEDSLTQAEKLRYLLENRGYKVDIASNGKEAFEKVKNRAPDLIISDIIMPKMDGYQLCNQVKTSPNLRDIPVILLTSLFDPKDIIRGLERGADSFVTKPYDEKHLFSTIQNVLANRKFFPQKDVRKALEVEYGGETYNITSNRFQILSLLLSIYETSVQKNIELIKTQNELKTLNERLEERVKERTAELQQKSEEVKTVSQQLWQTAKLATMGELSASIAHELNNPLAIVSLRVESLKSTLQENDPKKRQLEIIEGEVERMSRLVANLLQFSRRSSQQISSVNIEKEVESTLELIYYNLRNRGINLVKNFPPDMPLIQADRQQLRQLLLNLFTNASDVMSEGGVLTINIEVDRRLMVIEVCDTGVGISPENLRKVYEPFFTTKPEGKGTGLGLAICRRVVQEHNGTLEIKSELGKGTTVRIALPIDNVANRDHLNERES